MGGVASVSESMLGSRVMAGASSGIDVREKGVRPPFPCSNSILRYDARRRRGIGCVLSGKVSSAEVRRRTFVGLNLGIAATAGSGTQTTREEGVIGGVTMQGGAGATRSVRWMCSKRGAERRRLSFERDSDIGGAVMCAGVARVDVPARTVAGTGACATGGASGDGCLMINRSSSILISSSSNRRL